MAGRALLEIFTVELDCFLPPELAAGQRDTPDGNIDFQLSSWPLAHKLEFKAYTKISGIWYCWARSTYCLI